jgi:hypothetical protein
MSTLSLRSTGRAGESDVGGEGKQCRRFVPISVWVSAGDLRRSGGPACWLRGRETIRDSPSSTFVSSGDGERMAETCNLFVLPLITSEPSFPPSTGTLLDTAALPQPGILVISELSVDVNVSVVRGGGRYVITLGFISPTASTARTLFSFLLELIGSLNLPEDLIMPDLRLVVVLD